MNTPNNNAQIDALSDNELDAVSGGGDERVQVTREEWEYIIAQKIIDGKPMTTSR
jgi:bacteriocin-like protein